ncbi:hypothetical protein ACWGJW_17325 [Streptomyces nigrescens]
MTMPSCLHCGALQEDAAATSCPSCGMPRGGGVFAAADRPAGTAGHGYVRVGPTILPLWLLWLMAGLIVVGGVTAVVLASSTGSSDDGAVDVISSATPTPDPAIGSMPPTDIGSIAPTYPETMPPTDLEAPSPSDLSPSPDNASAIVEEYYRDINAGDFSGAWDLGGKNIGGSSYSKWVSGFDTTAHIELSAVSDGAIVSADITQR